MADTTVNTRPGSALRRAIPVLGFTQMVGWGTTYYLPAVLSPVLQRELGLNQPEVFGAVTVMLITSAMAGIPLGKLIDRLGARRIMPPGSILIAFGLLLLSQAQGPVSYFASYICMGIAMPVVLSTGAHAALAQMAGTGARRAIGLLMIFGGLAATFFWPLTLWLEGLFGWRQVVLLYASLHVLVCAPLLWHFIGERAELGELGDDAAAFLQGIIPEDMRRKAAVLMLTCFSCSGFLSWGLDLHLIRLLQDLGLTAAVAVGLAALKGPATLLARVSDVLAAGRISAVASAIIAAVLTALSLFALLLTGQSVVGAVLFVTVFGFGAGLMTVARVTMPLTLLGAAGYAATMGRLSLPTQLVFAAAPLFFGVVIDRYGVTAAVLVAVAASFASLLALLALAQLIRQARP
jgi:predicted MFS family arabinose efflux permease